MIIWFSFCILGIIGTRQMSTADAKWQFRAYMFFCEIAAIAYCGAFVLDLRADRSNTSVTHVNNGFRPALITVISCCFMLPVIAAGCGSFVWELRSVEPSLLIWPIIRLLIAGGMLRTFYGMIISRATKSSLKGDGD